VIEPKDNYAVTADPMNEKKSKKIAPLGVTPMLAQYLEIKREHIGSLLFYRMGDFYELFFEDAIEAAHALDITLTKRGKHKNQDIPMCGVPFHAADTYLGRLIRKGFKVAICEQIEDPADARKRGGKSVVKRAVVRVITPGTVTEETLLEARRNNFLASVVEIQESVGMAWVDVSTGSFQTEALSLNQLGGALARVAPTEILVPDRVLETRNGCGDFASQLTDCRDRLTSIPSSRFDSANSEKRLAELYGVNSLDSYGSFSRAELAAAGALVDYLELTQLGKIPRLLPPKQWKNSETLEVDNATRINLELVRTVAGERKGSLLDIMDRTVTGGGSRLLATRLNAPPTDPNIIKERLESVDYFFESERQRLCIRNTLKSVPDIERSLSRLSVDRAGPRDLIAIRNALLATASIRAQLNKLDGKLTGLPTELEKNVTFLGCHDELVMLLTRALIDEPPMFAREGGFIKSGYDMELDRLRSLRDESRNLIVSLQQRYAEETGINSIKIKHNNVLGYFVEMTSMHANKMTEYPTFIHRQTLANATRFTTLELTELERDLGQAAAKSLALEQECFAHLSNEVINSYEAIFNAGTAISEIDLFSGLAELAIERRYVRPTVTGGLEFEIIDGRHPVVEALSTDGERFVSNNCEMKVANRLWLLTGPNMAGKSTFLRQNALITLMAQMGSFVPATSARIGVIDRLFSRVGAADDLARGRSTFMVEMVETAAILNQATARSLVILDEIGRGTATFDGLSIAWAAIEHLHEINGCRTLFATHYHELTSLQSKLDSLVCYTMKIKEWQEEIVFMHELVKGTADRSYGIHVAKIAGLPTEVVDRAKIILEVLEKGEKANSLRSLADDLPLFKDTLKDSNQGKELAESEVDKLLAQIQPDDLSPREALELIYRLKDMVKEFGLG